MQSELRLPRPREVWSVCDKDIILHLNNRVYKAARFVLVVMVNELIEDHNSSFNIIPLSASAKPDRVSIPIARGYEDIVQGFEPKETSCALINFYQPIHFPSTKKYKGRIDIITYECVKNSLCKQIVGLDNYDLDI